MRRVRRLSAGFFSSWMLLTWCFTPFAEGLSVPNPSFEKGGETPEGWSLSGGEGSWIGEAADGKRAISTTGEAGPGETNYWRSSDLPFQSNAVYQLTFQAKRIEGNGGCPITGPVFCNRDLSGVKEEWTPFTSRFVTPRQIQEGESWLRFGQWEVDGTVAYDQVHLVLAHPVHLTRDEIELGEGERIQGREYIFQAPYRTDSANYSRCLASHHCFFNTHRWVFGADRNVVYRHKVGDLSQVAASVSPAITWYQSGELLVEASKDGERWVEVSFLDDEKSGPLDLPERLFPAKEIWIRLSARASSRLGKDSDPGSFQVSGYEYKAKLNEAPGDLTGNTTFFCSSETDPRLKVTFQSLSDPIPGEAAILVARVENLTDKPIQAKPTLRLRTQGEDAADEFTLGDVSLRPGPQRLELPYELQCVGKIQVLFSLGKDADFAAEASFRVSPFYAVDYGKALPGSTEKVGLWWAESGWKIPRTTPVRRGRGIPLRVELARNEAEAVQMVVQPALPLNTFSIQAQDLKSSSGALLPAAQIDLLRVGYVPITQVSDEEGCVADWPDPLPPLKEPMRLKEGQAHPFWVRVRTNKETPAGIYRGALELQAEDYIQKVPLEVTVFDFELPDRMTLTSAFGMNPGNIFRYHGLQTEEQKREVLDKYFANYSDHHISVYNLAPLDPIEVQWKGVGDWEGGLRDTEIKRSGKSSLRVSDESETSGTNAGLVKLVRIPEEGLHIKLWHRTKEPGQEFLVTLMHHDSAKQWMYGKNSDIRVKGRGDWQLFEKTVKDFPEGTEWIRFRLWPCLFSEEGATTGTTWFDDVFLRDAGSGKVLAHGNFEPLDLGQLEPVFDWTDWDKSMERAIDRYHFNSFNIRPPGLGGGTFHARYEPNLLGYGENTPEYRAAFRAYCRKLEAHLKGRGWLDEAYVYWFDEPDPKDYEFVMNGFRKIKEHAPGLGRMLTEQVEAELIGGPNIWCPLTPHYDPDLAAERRKAGDTFWWYICTGPKAPYAGLFIDHAGTEFRVWLWQTWKRRISGILIWETTYWTSGAAYPDPNHPQNPYEDPMGWVSGYSTPAGTKRAWGNGDGRFVYPPEEAANAHPLRPVMEGPVDSIRWEMLRDGIEDYEYMALLDRLLKERGPKLSERKTRQMKHLLKVPQEISEDLTHFTKDPDPILKHRSKVAHAIEELGTN